MCKAKRSSGDNDRLHVFGDTRIDKKSRLTHPKPKEKFLKLDGHGTESNATGIELRI